MSRSAAAELWELPRELQQSSVGEEEARSSGALRVVSCPRCFRRLCVLGREGRGTSSSVWKVPGTRVERAWLGGGSSIKCRICGQGRVTVEVLPPGGAGEDAAAAAGSDADMPAAHPLALGGSGGAGGADDRLSLQRVALRMPPRSSAFRPFRAVVCGLYESVVERAAGLLQADAITMNRALCVEQKTYRRSELAKLAESDLPSSPVELLVVAHKITGPRNPLTDSAGLYTQLLAHGWQRADVVLLLLFDVPCGYLVQLLEEQPTLLGLLGAGRLLPLLTASAEAEAEAVVNVDSGTEKNVEEAEAAWWIVRCLDGRVPRVDALPAAGCASDTKLARETAVAAATAGVNVRSTLAILAQVAEGFDGQALVRD